MSEFVKPKPEPNAAAFDSLAELIASEPVTVRDWNQKAVVPDHSDEHVPTRTIPLRVTRRRQTPDGLLFDSLRGVTGIDTQPEGVIEQFATGVDRVTIKSGGRYRINGSSIRERHVFTGKPSEVTALGSTRLSLPEGAGSIVAADRSYVKAGTVDHEIRTSDIAVVEAAKLGGSILSASDESGIVINSVLPPDTDKTLRDSATISHWVRDPMSGLRRKTLRLGR